MVQAVHAMIEFIKVMLMVEAIKATKPMVKAVEGKVKVMAMVKVAFDTIKSINAIKVIKAIKTIKAIKAMVKAVEAKV